MKSTFALLGALAVATFALPTAASANWLENARWSRDNCDVKECVVETHRRCHQVQRAINLAQHGQEGPAFNLMLNTQCHNGGAAQTFRANRNDLIKWLKEGGP